MRFLVNLANRAAKIQIDDANTVLLRKSFAHLCQGLGVVVPDLHRQRSRFVLDAPEAVRMLRLISGLLFGPMLARFEIFSTTSLCTASERRAQLPDENITGTLL